MGTRGPASLLDRRETDVTTHVVRDRLTRRRSPARESNRYSYTSDISLEDEEVASRIPQPYKTSFSAVTLPARTRRDRSRSTSPATSSLKGRNRHRSKSPGGRRKHVTYDEKVVIRESGTQDSIVTNLSDHDNKENISVNSSVLSSEMSASSQRDYSSELRELSQQIVREYPLSSDKESPVLATRTSNNHSAIKTSTPNGNASQYVDYGSKSPTENGQSYYREGKSRIVIKEDYDHDRSVSYRVAIKQNYSDEVKQKADSMMEEIPPKENSRPSSTRTSESEERRNSLPLENDEAIAKSRLTPSKRSISASIGNFFRKLSPHLGRKNKKGNLSTASSQSLSPGDDLDGSLKKNASTSNLSRGKLRRSLQKLFKPKSSRKSDSSVEDVNGFENTSEGSQQRKAPNSSLYMKSIEQTGQNDKDMYHKFKEKKTSHRTGEVTTSSKPMKVSPRVMSPDSDKSPSNEDFKQEVSPRGEKAEPPNTLDVRLVPKSIKSLQSSQISTISGDDSIGDCSIDPNLTGSEPSLLSQSSASKQVALSQASEDASRKTTPDNKENEIVTPVKTSELNSKQPLEIKLKYPPMPLISDSTEFLPKEPVRTPSYLRISSAVSGYGHYSRYSAYKGIEKRSPYSSTLSLRSSRSDLTTPQSPTEMPIGKILNIQAPTNYPPLKNDVLSPKAQLGAEKSEFPLLNGASVDLEHVNGDSQDVNGDNHVNGEVTKVSETVNGSENGHVIQVGNYNATGDHKKDGEFFLSVAQTEETRLLMLCSRCEMELVGEGLPEEASGKLRSAVGKANLLISQKFRQFQDLCQQHMHPELHSKETKWEDLQGFWEMVKLQVDDLDEMFTEIDLMRQNGWREIKPPDLQGFWEMVKLQVDDLDEMFTEIDLMRQNGWREIKPPSRRSSSSSSPKSGSQSVSNASTPSHTPGSKRRAARLKDTPESSPERTQKAKMAAKVREDARKKLLAEKRAAMKQQKLQGNSENVEIFVADNSSTKGDSPSRTADQPDV